MANGRLILPALGLRNTKRMVQHRLTILRTGCPLSPQALNNTHDAPMRTTLSFEMAGIPILVGLVHTPAEGILQVARVRAVSYTHLRAHETKANLVCRLLLEKKKQPHCSPCYLCRLYQPRRRIDITHRQI